MKNKQYRPLPQAGENRYKIHLAIVGNKAVLILLSNITRVVIRRVKAPASLCPPGATAQANPGSNPQETPCAACKAAGRLDSKPNANINN